MVLGAVTLPFMPGSMTAYAAETTLSGSESYTAQDGDVLTGSTSGTVTIADNANITLNNATISGGIVCKGSATITLVGTNGVSGATNKAGIQIGDSGTTLTINGDGSLTATGGYNSAGIGLSALMNYDSNVSSGNIVIEGGTIMATGGHWGAGIGTGVIKNTNNDNSTSVQFGNVTIKGGTVTATGGDSGDGIGKGYSYYGPAITFGTVTIYDDIDMVDATSISESVTYMHDETDVTANASNYFTIIEDGDRRIIAPKDDTDYTITIADDIEYGTLTGAATAKYMEKVTITATPDLGYRLSGLVVKDADNNDVATTGNSFFMPKGNVTVSAVFEQGTHGTTEFAWGYLGQYGFVTEATIYDGVTTVELQQGQSYRILKYDEDSYRKFLLDNDIYNVTIPYSGGTGTFTYANGTNFRVDYNDESGYYDITMTDAGNGKWSVSILKTVGVIGNIPDQTYTGSEIKPEPQVMAGSLSLTKGTDYTYSYTDNTNVGTAKVIVTFKGDYASLGSVEKEFNIVPPHHIHNFSYSAEGATITATCSTADCTLTDNKKTLTINAPIKTIYGDANSASATLTGLDDFNSATSLNITETGIKYVGRGNTTYAESDTAPTDAGTYTASITAGGKTASVDYTIAPKSISITGATATDRDYVKDSTSVEISAVTFDGATLTNETDYIVTGAMDDDTAGDSKSVTVTVTLTNGNYTFGTNGNTTTTNVKINKVNHDGVSASGSAKYGAEGMVDLSSLIEAGGSLGEVSVTDTNGVLDGTPTIETDGKTLKFKFSNNSDNVGKTATVTIPVEGATNYKDYNIVVTLTVTDKVVPTLSVSDFTKTYDGNAVTISELTKTAKVGSSDVEGTWTFEGNPGLKDVSDSGSITVKFTPTYTANYESATATFMLTINRKAVTVKADNKSMVVGTTPEPELTATVSGTVGSDTVNYTITREAGTAVGTYTITPSGDKLQGNYTVSYETGTFTITEDTTAPVVKKAPKAITGLVYNGTVQALVEPGEAENGTMYYAVTTENTAPTDENLYTTSIPTRTNAGTYYVWYKVVGDANHNGTEPNSIEAKINPVDKTDLNTAIEEAEAYYESIKEDDVYAQVAEALKKAIDEAKKYTNDNVAEKEVKEAIDTIKAAKVDAEEGKKEADDTVLANEVADAINALPDGDEVEVTDKEKIEAARKAYDALTDDQKAKVPADTLNKLEDAEKALEDAEQKEAEKEEADTDAAKKVTDAINALPASDKIATTDKAAIEAARKAYNALTADQKKKVSADTLKKLENAEKALADAEKNTSDDDKKDEDKPDYKNEWVDGQWYGADGNTEYKAKGSWKQNDKGWWYEDTDGWYPKSQWQKIDGKWYYFTADGYMDYSEYRDGYWLGSDGAWDETYSGGHWMQDATGWWYVDATGWYPVNRYLWVDGVQYWFNANGYWE